MQIVKVYSGKANSCMCGCNGKWSYTSFGKDKTNYPVDVNERSVKLIANKVLNDPDKIVEKDYTYTISNNRIRAVYYND